MNDPNKIGEQDIQKFSTILQFSPEKEKEFRQIIKHAISGYNEDERARVLEILYSNPTFLEDKPSEVESFNTEAHPGGSVNCTIRTYEDIVDSFVLEESCVIKLRILNCSSIAAISSLYTLISKLRTRVQNCPPAVQETLKITIEHIVTIGHLDAADKIKLIFNIAHSIQFPDYSAFFLNYLDANGDKRSGGNSGNSIIANYLENKVLIHIGKDGLAENDKYHIFHISNIKGKRDYCLETSEPSYFSFHRTIFDSLKSEVTLHNSFRSRGAVEISEELSQYPKPYHNLLLKADPCLDNILPEIWLHVADEIAAHPGAFAKLRSRLDRFNKYIYLDDDTFYKANVQILTQRFMDNEHPGSIIIYDVQGFSDFARTGFTSETAEDFPVIDPDDRRKQLRYMIDQIQNHYGDDSYQQYYFARNAGTTSHLFVKVVDNRGIYVVSNQCYDYINASFFFAQPELAKLLYDVAASSLPSTDRVLSQGESLVFLQNLLEAL
ncbi:MAG: hypothetical protein FWG40_07345 [Peptococcaceae bacterium]|nr:hypothetical protein [Peptococcaceae bacterium]